MLSRHSFLAAVVMLTMAVVVVLRESTLLRFSLLRMIWEELCCAMLVTNLKLQGTRNPVTGSDTVWTESKDILKCCVEKLYGHFDASSIFMWRLVQSPPFYQEPWFCMPPSAEKQETSSMHGETTENMYLLTYNSLSYCQRLHLHRTTVGLVHFFFFYIFLCYFQHKNKYHDQQLEQFNAQGDICTPVVR